MPGGMPMPPMGYGPPPMGFYPPPPMMLPPPRKRGFGGALLTTAATTLFGLSLVLNVYLIAFAGLTGDHGGTEGTIHSGSKDKVAVVPIVNQLIRQASADDLDKLLKQVEADDSVKALVLRIDTPGGEVTPSDQMYHRVLMFKTRRPGVPVVVSMGALATSGGYYVAMAGDDLFAEPTTLTVNVGVYGQNLNFAGLMQKYGVTDETTRSTKSPYKTAGTPFREPTADEKAYIQAEVDGYDQTFRDVVAAGRQGRLKAPLDEVCNGKAYHAKAAEKLGAIDGVKYADEVYQYAATKAGLTNPTVVKFQTIPTLVELLTGQTAARTTPPEQATLKVNGVSLSSPAIDAILDPRPMYLYRPQ